MRRSTSALLITASAFALIAATPALAQDQTQADSVDDIVVTGTRVQNRSRLDSVAPVWTSSAMSKIPWSSQI